MTAHEHHHELPKPGDDHVSAGFELVSEQLATAQSRLAAAIEATLAGASNGPSLKEASHDLELVRTSLDALKTQLGHAADAPPKLRDCPSCGHGIRLDASRCGYCWNASAPQPKA